MKERNFTYKTKKRSRTKSMVAPGREIMKAEPIKETAERKALEEVALQCTYSKILGVKEIYFIHEHEMKFDIHTIILFMSCYLGNPL